MLNYTSTTSAGTTTTANIFFRTLDGPESTVIQYVWAQDVTAISEPWPFRLSHPAVERSRRALAGAVARSLAPLPAPRASAARHGFQEMCRLPCYRGVRTR